MRIFTTQDTLFIRGTWRAASTGVSGGIRPVTTLLNHTVSPDFSSSPERVITQVAARKGFDPAKTFGLLSAVPMKFLCIVQVETITACIIAGINKDTDGDGTITIIICAAVPLSDAALLDAIITVSDAKACVMRKNSYESCKTRNDAVIIASEITTGNSFQTCTQSVTPVRILLDTAVSFGVNEALNRYNSQVPVTSPAYFIHSSIGGGHWFEWKKGSCPYYPCHFQGQRCDYCYCPLYPCADETLGDWVMNISGKARVWSCARCILNHQPVVTDHLKKYPESSIIELKHLISLHGLPFRQEKPDPPTIEVE